MSALFEDLPPLLPLDFFQVEATIPYASAFLRSTLFHKKVLLPDTSSLLGEDHFADIFLGWNEEKLWIQAFVAKPFEESYFPEFARGDSLELFIDTRDIKGSGFAGRFCHHFLILPSEVQGVRARELTHFRSDESHPLCDPSQIELDVDMKPSSYEMRIGLPAEILHGYEPALFDRLGFTYRLNRFGDQPQHFSLSSDYFSIPQHPGLWASLKLNKEQ